MLIIALVLAAIGLAALVFAVVTSNALVAWVCIGASVLGVLLLVVDALRERRANLGALEAPANTEDTATPEDAEDVGALADAEESDVDAEGDAEVESSEAAEVVDYDAEAADEAEPAAHPAD